MQERKIAIATDSACDIPDEMLKEHGIRFVPLRVVTKQGEYRDRVEISADELYQMLETEIPRSSLPLPSDVEDLYDELAAEGYTDVIQICISSGLSGTYNMVRMLAKDYTKLRVHAVDTKTLSIHQGFIALCCARLARQTQDVDEILKLAEGMRKSSRAVFVIRTLEYLRKGGRIGLVEGVLGTMLNLKPVIWVNDDGIYETIAKARGHKGAIETMVQKVQEAFTGTKNRIKLAVVHGNAPEEGETLLTRMKTLLSPEEALLLPVSPVLGVHTGPGLLGIIAISMEPT